MIFNIITYTTVTIVIYVTHNIHIVRVLLMLLISYKTSIYSIFQYSIKQIYKVNDIHSFNEMLTSINNKRKCFKKL